MKHDERNRTIRGTGAGWSRAGRTGRRAVKTWIGEFVDLGGRNTLLYYRDLKQGTPGHRSRLWRGTRALHQPRRSRKLLLHRSEIGKIIGRLGDAGVTLVPLSLYFQDGWVEIALARGRRYFDKRQAIARRDADREIARELSDRLRGRRRQARGSN